MKLFAFCYHNNEELIHLFDQDRFDKDSLKYVHTWSYYECPTCHQILVFKREEE